MRLIDADELIKGRVENDPVRIAAMCAPTAYDVEERAKEIYVLGKQAGEAANLFDDEYAEGQMMAYYDSEKIVRYGMGHLTKPEESPDGKRLREREEFFREG